MLTALELTSEFIQNQLCWQERAQTDLSYIHRARTGPTIRIFNYLFLYFRQGIVYTIRAELGSTESPPQPTNPQMFENIYAGIELASDLIHGKWESLKELFAGMREEGATDDEIAAFKEIFGQIRENIDSSEEVEE